MSSKSVRREYLEAVAEFERGCKAFAAGMRTALQEEGASTPQSVLSPLGPRKPAKRAPRRDTSSHGRVQHG